MPRPALLAALLALAPVAASADAALTITFDMKDVITASYDCGEGGPLFVVYVASEASGLARVPVDGHDRVFAEAVSGSGARYVLGRYEWVTKGEAGALIDTLEDETVLDCGPADR